MASVNPGERRIARMGRHAGVEVEVVKQTAQGRVVFRHVGGAGTSWSKAKSEDAGLQTVDFDFFERQYRPKSATDQINGRGGQSYRRKRQLPDGSQLVLEPEVEAPPPPPPPDGRLLEHYVHQGDTHLSISVELITPDMARAWLERGGANRHIVERRVLRLMTVIESGQWELTGDSIKLDAQGRVRDGQHRLTAIVRTRIPVLCLVVRNVTEAAFDVIDTGKARSAADVLAIHGHTYGVAKATAARALILLERTGRPSAPFGWRHATITPTHTDMLSYVEAHPEITEAVLLGERLRKPGEFIGGTGLWSVALALFLRVNPEQTRVFVDSLIEGANLEARSPILKLRNMYKGSARAWAASSENRENLLAIVIKAWNAWRKDELVSQLSWRSEGPKAEDFPVAE